MNPKVLIVTCTISWKMYCWSEFVRQVVRQTFKEFDWLIIDNSETEENARMIAKYMQGQTVFNYEVQHLKPDSHPIKIRMADYLNIARQKVLDGEYSHLLVLEQDIMMPLDCIERLIKHNVPVVCALYHYNTNGEPDYPITNDNYLLMEYKSGHNIRQLEPKLLPTEGTPTGCLLIKREVLEKIKFRPDDQGGFPDCSFGRDTKDFKKFIDLSLECRHDDSISGNHYWRGLAR